jgi:TolB-like protein
LAKDPNRRYQSVDELLGDFEAVRNQQDLARKTAMYNHRQKLKRRKRLLYSVLAAFVTIAVVTAWWVRHQDQQRIDALAVLPFANLSGDEEQEYFADGMTEALITELQQLVGGDFRVISRTSVMRYKETELSLPEIAAELGVDVLVEASVIRSGDLVKIVAKLIRARPQERQMWADSYERDIKEIISLHANVARNVAENLGLILSEDDGESRQVDPESYEEYLIGTHIINSTGEVERALPHFEKAVAIDSTFAPAWAWAAHCHIMPTHFGWPSPIEKIETARLLAERAIELDPNYADAYFILAHILWEHDWDMPAAQEAFGRGFELNPNGGSGIGLLTVAMFHLIHGRIEEAVQATRKARDLDPFGHLINVAAFNVLSPAGLYEESMASLERAQVLFPDVDLRHNLSWAFYWMGDYEEAIRLKTELLAEADSEYGKFIQTLMLAHFHKCAGNPEETRRLYDRYWPPENPEMVRPWARACMYADLGEVDEAFAWLVNGYEQKDRYMALLQVYSREGGVFGELAEDPRHKALLVKIGLED